MRERSALPARERLRADVERLAVPRHPVANPEALRAAEDHVAGELGAAGLRVERQLFRFGGREYHNVLGTLDGTDPSLPWVVLGAHFDSVARSPGADDNASGVAALLEAARLLAAARPAATVQCVGFNLEEIQNPFRALRLGGDVHAIGSFRIGSLAYARRLRAGGQAVAGALVLEMLGFTGERQRAPAAVRLFTKVPATGDFLAAVGDGRSRDLLAAFARAAQGVLPLVRVAVPLRGWLAPDVRRSDHARFWDAGYPALLLTDTAELRNPHYHRASDTPETLDYAFLARATEAVVRCALELASAERKPTSEREARGR